MKKIKEKLNLSCLLISTLILSACLSTGSNYSIIGGYSKAPADFIEHKFDGRNWTPKYQAGHDLFFLTEMTVGKDNINNWSELLTSATYFNTDFNVLSTEFINVISKCPNIKLKTNRTSKKNITIFWEHNGCGKFKGQKEISKYMQGSDGTYTLSYTVINEKFKKDKYNIWKKNIEESRLVLKHNLGKKASSTILIKK